MSKPCTECGGKLREKVISQEFEREGKKVRLSGIHAWVCSRCGEVYFLPGGGDRVAKAANCLFDLAETEEQHRGRIVARVSLDIDIGGEARSSRLRKNSFSVIPEVLIGNPVLVNSMTSGFPLSRE